MDLKSLEMEETARRDVIHPLTGEVVTDDDGNPMWYEVYGSDTKHYRKAVAEVARDTDNAENSAEILIMKCILTWDIVVDGRSPKVAEAVEIFAALPWLRDQIDRAMHTRANFIKPASKASKPTPAKTSS